jgi:hypothetical protein
MLWFRSHIGFGARLALFALAAQMVLSFGHVHLPSGAAIAGGPRLLVDQATAPGWVSSAPIHKSDGLADSACPICALIQLASSAAPSGAPAVLSPATFAAIRLRGLDELPVSASPRQLFRARAPPSTKI